MLYLHCFTVNGRLWPVMPWERGSQVKFAELQNTTPGLQKMLNTYFSVKVEILFLATFKITPGCIVRTDTEYWRAVSDTSSPVVQYLRLCRLGFLIHKTQCGHRDARSHPAVAPDQKPNAKTSIKARLTFWAVICQDDYTHSASPVILVTGGLWNRG